MKWWEWLMPWRWPVFRKRRAAASEVQNRFQAALKDAETRHTDLNEAAEKLKEGRERRKAESVASPRLHLESHRQ